MRGTGRGCVGLREDAWDWERVRGTERGCLGLREDAWDWESAWYSERLRGQCTGHANMR